MGGRGQKGVFLGLGWGVGVEGDNLILLWIDLGIKSSKKNVIKGNDMGDGG